MSNLTALLWIIAGTVWLAFIIGFLADNDLLDWLYDSAFMAWFECRLWTPLKRRLGLEAMDAWIERRRGRA